MTDNKIGVEGAKLLSEILKKNTTLTSLNMGRGGIWENREREKREMMDG